MNNDERMYAPKKITSKRLTLTTSRSSLPETTNRLIVFILVLYAIGLIQTYLALPHLSLTQIVFPGWGSRSSMSSTNNQNKNDDNLVAMLYQQSMNNQVKWPVTVLRGEKYETIKHPADSKMSVSVPQFYLDHVTDGRLMTRKEADGVGIQVPVTIENGEVQMMPTIFVAIASYRDWQCRHTVESIFRRAKHPERIRVGVVDQIENGVDDPCDIPINPCAEDPEQALCKYNDRIDVFEMEAALSVGPVFARHVGHRMYRGEYYSMQWYVDNRSIFNGLSFLYVHCLSQSLLNLIVMPMLPLLRTGTKILFLNFKPRGTIWQF